jgi:hypothetical protein
MRSIRFTIRFTPGTPLLSIHLRLCAPPTRTTRSYSRTREEVGRSCWPRESRGRWTCVVGSKLVSRKVFEVLYTVWPLRHDSLAHRKRTRNTRFWPPFRIVFLPLPLTNRPPAFFSAVVYMSTGVPAATKCPTPSHCYSVFTTTALPQSRALLSPQLRRPSHLDVNPHGVRTIHRSQMRCPLSRKLMVNRDTDT